MKVKIMPLVWAITLVMIPTAQALVNAEPQLKSESVSALVAQPESTPVASGKKTSTSYLTQPLPGAISLARPEQRVSPSTSVTTAKPETKPTAVATTIVSAPVEVKPVSQTSSSSFAKPAGKKVVIAAVPVPVAIKPASVTTPVTYAPASGKKTQNPFTNTSPNYSAHGPASVTLVLNSGNLLSQDIKTWAEKSGFKLLWRSKSDYLIYSPIVLAGKNNDEVLTALGRLFASENYGLIIKNYQKNHVLLIDDM
ncbi:TcpQ domain-containing protein [Scandinavium sp. V105_16]|uniref:TcpQ domain-containing protein n=1 Tax=Scandinavium lactucae TaxID=3095028 RepID=A0AAJ2S565_9ENTR|nr:MULTISPECIES: TcpQ domain-containing protein [unclassified Scandinavium]MDX6019669.1 TcpQ domain-containing protein [Scandinavium sp. V105_16]MDX6032672.1 TcpQ domain-containing protein [Scandinavium sp. V105_12]